jgi:hypothetical protein
VSPVDLNERLARNRFTALPIFRRRTEKIRATTFVARNREQQAQVASVLERL